MACGCAHSIRWVTRTTICLDVVYDLLGKQKKNLHGAIADGADTQPLLLESPPEAVDSKSKKESNSKVNWCFFLGGIGLSLLWNAFAFIVPYWVLHYDPNIWRDFVVCYNAPGFPILVLQLLTDEKLAKRFGTRKTYIARITFSLLLVAGLAALVPITQLTGKQFGRFEMLAFTTCIGIAVGSGHGWIYSVVSYYPHQAVAYLAAGGGFATIMLVIITLLQNYPADETLVDLFKYFEPVFFLSILGSMCVVALFFTNYSKVLLQNIDHQTYGGIQENPNDEPNLKDEKPAARDASGPIWKVIWSPLVSVFLLMTTIVAAVALIPSIPSATNNPNFSAYILYVTTIFAFVGNEIAVYAKAMTSSWPLVIFSAIRFLMLPFFIVYAETKFWLNDYFILSMLAIFGASGAFGVSKCYSVCSMSVSVNQQASASNYLNIVLYVGVYVGLAFPYVLPYL